MVIQKLIELRQVPARDVITWDSLPVLVRGSLPVLRGRRLRVGRSGEPQQGRRTQNQS
jgi:hypothetical protein